MDEKILEAGIRATLNFTADEIRIYAQRIRARDLGFSPNETEISDLRGIIKLPEMKIYKKYLTEPTHRKLAKSGLWCRRNEGNDKPVILHLDKIRKDHKKKGILIVALIQNGIVFNLIQRLIMDGTGDKEIKERLYILLNDIEKYASLVSNAEKEENLIKKLNIRLKGVQPDIIIIFASGNAVPKLNRIVKSLKKSNPEYYSVTYEEETYIKKKSIFLCRDEMG